MNAGALRAATLEALHRIAPEADLAQLSPEADLRSALDLDSFDLLQLLVALHRKLGVDIPEADAGGLTTLSRIVGYLEARLAAGGSPTSESANPRPGPPGGKGKAALS
jgi:acyl carrier protein